MDNATTVKGNLWVRGSLFVGALALAVSIGAVTHNSGTTVIRESHPTYYSGSYLPIFQAITLSETNGTASGAISIENPYDKTLLCDTPTIRITTAAAPDTLADIWTGTGAIGTSQSGTTIANNFSFGTTGVFTFTGATALNNLGERFILYPYGSTADTTPSRINIQSRNGTGASLAAKLLVPCHVLD